MKPRHLALLWDARRAGETSQTYVAGLDFAGYEGNDLVRSAVERQLTILGEALNMLRRVAPDVAARIADLNGPVAMRHVLVHGYAEVDNEKVWAVLHEHLPPLLATIRALLAEAEADA